MNDHDEPSNRPDPEDDPVSDAPDSEIRTARSEGSYRLDDDGIPILEEVISRDEGYIDSSEIPASEPPVSDSGDKASPQRLVLPDHQTVLAALRRRLKEQLSDELAEVVHETARLAAKQTSRDLKHLIQDQLTQSLEIRLNTLIEKALDEQFGDTDS